MYSTFLTILLTINNIESSSRIVLSDQALSLISDIAPFITAIVLFYLSSSRESKISKNKVDKERLETIYIPFYRMSSFGLFSPKGFGSFTRESRISFLNLISNNVHLLDTNSQELFPDFFHAFTSLDLPDVNVPNADEIFKQMEASMNAEYRYLLNKLNF